MPRKGERGFLRRTGIEAPVIRWWPGTIWVRIGIDFTGTLPVAWRPQNGPANLTAHIFWPLLAGRGPYAFWLRKDPDRMLSYRLICWARTVMWVEQSPPLWRLALALAVHKAVMVTLKPALYQEVLPRPRNDRSER